MDISNWVHSFAGGVHFVCSIIGMIAGVFVLLRRKGTRAHRLVGYAFVVCLLGVNLTALFIYDFNDGAPGVFHFLIPVSLFFLLFGFLPMRGRRKANALNRHIIGMIGAVYGLFAAGATEYFVREMAEGLGPNALIIWSFVISTPFAVAITVSIIVFRRRYIRALP
jgi:uncharacterized membrane protein